jgi:paraquat-inducible protein A
MKVLTSALQQGFIRCHDCGGLIACRLNCLCPVCGSAAEARKPKSLERTAALILSGFSLYLPANIFPIMTVTELGHVEPHTITGGIIALVKSDMIPIAALVFIASILVPLLKLLGLTLLLLCVRNKWHINARLLTACFRVIAFVGRWSMLDIFMLSILIALVDTEGVAQVIAGPAATAFAAVVVLTMLAAKCFDPRLLWDYRNQNGK